MLAAQTLTLGRRIAALLLLAAAMILWSVLAPPTLGGSTTYVITRGISMEPSFHTGDLALVRPQSSYEVGEIVAYRSRTLHTIVLHRIVARDGARYVFKGDNNGFRDPEHPARDQLVGRLWLHVPHGGLDLAPLRKPWALGLLAGLGALLLFGGSETRRRSRGRRGAQQPAPHWTETAVVCAGAALAASIAVGALAFSRPVDAPAQRSVAYTQRGGFSYVAAARRGPVYPGGTATTGDPLFVRLVGSARVSFAYRLLAAVPSAVHGQARLDGELVSSTGWRRTWTLVAPRPFSGAATRVTATLPLRSLESLLRRVETATGAPAQSYVLTLRPRVTVDGFVGGARVHARYQPTLALSMDATSVAPDPAAVFHPARGGAVRVATRTPRTLTLLRLHPAVATARVLALLGLAASLAGLGIGVLLLHRGHGAAEADRIRARFGDRLVAVSASDAADYTDVVDVRSIDELARVAERYDRMILDHGDDYRVADDGVLYRYRLADAS